MLYPYKYFIKVNYKMSKKIQKQSAENAHIHIQQNDKPDFKTEVVNKLEDIYINGFTIDDKTYKINKIITIYVKNMKLKFNYLGQTYLNNMVKDVENIINNLTIKSNYDNLEYVNNILNYCIKSLFFENKKISVEPKIPDYTLAEIKDMAKTIE